MLVPLNFPELRMNKLSIAYLKKKIGNLFSICVGMINVKKGPALLSY
jgi:hypothetical protein